MVTLNRTKLLEYLDFTMDDELDLSRLKKYCVSDTVITKENNNGIKNKRRIQKPNTTSN